MFASVGPATARTFAGFGAGVLTCATGVGALAGAEWRWKCEQAPAASREAPSKPRVICLCDIDVTPKRKKWAKLALQIHKADEQPRRRET